MTVQYEKNMSLRILILITHAEKEKKLKRVLQEMHMPILHQCRAQGTAPSELLDLLGVCGTARIITVGCLPKCRSQEIFEILDRQMNFHKKGAGIALTIPVNGVQSSVHHLLSEEAEKILRTKIEREVERVKETGEFSVVWTSVVSGYSEEVIEAARAAGARGGTVIKGRRQNSGQVTEYLGIPMQEEQEFVLMVVPKEKKAEIMAAISASCGLKTPAHGIVMSLPVDEVMGIEQKELTSPEK